MVLGEVDPAEAAVGDAAHDLVLVGDQLPRLELRRERVGGAAVGAEALRPRGLAGLGAADGLREFLQENKSKLKLKSAE